jgi:hypothetical protein
VRERTGGEHGLAEVGGGDEKDAGHLRWG